MVHTYHGVRSNLLTTMITFEPAQSFRLRACCPRETPFHTPYLRSAHIYIFPQLKDLHSYSHESDLVLFHESLSKSLPVFLFLHDSGKTNHYENMFFVVSGLRSLAKEQNIPNILPSIGSATTHSSGFKKD